VVRDRQAYRGHQQGMTKAPPCYAQEITGCGLTVQEIATALGISRRTAFRYLAESIRSSDADP
jgi:DNA-binding transcriptional regulator LsrR (DeoR family)